MPMRFLIASEDIAQPLKPGQSIAVGAERAHYLIKVMRAKAGDNVACFDGHGRSFTAQLNRASTRACSLEITTVQAQAEQADSGLHLGMALLKGQAMDRALQQATELGAQSITLLQTQRANVRLKDGREDNKLGHWRKIIAGACEQSGHLYLPELHGPRNLDELLQDSNATITVLDMHGQPLPQRLEPVQRLLLIGPEGGWDDSEHALFNRYGLESYSVSAFTLRAETMPAVALALFQQLQARALAQ